MANLREIRSRINGVRSTSKITQAMKMVAAAKLRRAQDSIVSARPYAYGLADLVRHLLARVDRDVLPVT
ncbi:MAG: F0F1 ATP synthase subunit gamma, partial [Bacteroidetes bacterium]|nr:F0F1 ATP synthase subunit gamma [Bacteroidota bacterium]